MPGDTVALGDLRWPVRLYRRDQTPAASLGIAETLVPMGVRRAKIEALRPLTFWTAAGGEQTEAPVTHMIWMRWLDYPPTTWVIMRSTFLTDRVTLRVETFRVRRTMEMGGRKRFLQIEAELERVTE